MATGDQSEDGGEITRLLVAWSEGDTNALDRLMPLVHGRLRQIARNHLRREDPSHTLQPTDLVHEAYLKLVDQSRVRWQERRQFFSIAARLMRRVLVDHARERAARKRGGGTLLVTWNGGSEPTTTQSFDALEIDRALEHLSRFDARQAKLVELRFFGGLSFEEAGGVLAISPATAKRDWVHARAWLYRELTNDEPKRADSGEP